VNGVAANPLDDLDQPVLVTYADNTAPGTATAGAVFYGDAAHTGDTVSKTFTIGNATQTITFGALGNRTYGDPKFTVSATADSDLTVTFSTLTTTACTVTPAGEVAIVGAGTCTITASQAGNANYAAAQDVSQSFTISPATATLSFVTADLAQTYDGSPRSVGVTTTPAGLGTVTVTYAGISPTVYATSETAPTAAGSYTVNASLANANYTATPISGTLVVAKKAQTITFAALGDKTYLDLDFSVSATASSFLPVSFAAAGSCTVTGTLVHITGAGTCTITASQAGDSNHQAAPSVAQSFRVVQAFVRAEYTGDWFMYAGTAPRFSAMVYPAAAPDTGTTVTTIDYVAQGVTARVKVYPAADCGTTCDTATPAWQTTTPVPVTNGTGGVGTVETFGPSTLSDGAYIVVVELVLSNNLLGERAVAAFGVTPSTATYVVGGGAIPTANGANNPDNTRGYFGFNVRKQKNSATGSMAFVYRERISPTTGQTCDDLTSSTTASTSCRDVDVTIRTTSVTSASTTQSSTWPVTGTATGKVTVRFVDAISGTAYTGLTLRDYDFRFDGYDAAPGGAADQFGLTVYSALRPAASWYYSAAGTAGGQTGTAAATTLTTISLGDISAPPGNR
jgi:hypothetical protein